MICCANLHKMCIDRHGSIDPNKKIDISTQNVGFRVLSLVEYMVLTIFLDSMD